MRTLIVTGAGGYIGRHLVVAARADGWRVVAATRRPDERADQWLPYRLEDPPTAETFSRDAVIVHLAADTQRADSGAMEVEAAVRLIAVARERNARLVFISSQTARRDAPTPYGRTKWEIEQHVLAARGVVVRPGLVYGGVPGGLYARLLRLVRTKAVLPIFAPAPHVQPVHVDDLARALLAAADRDALNARVVRVAATEPMRFDTFLCALAQSLGRHGPRFLPLPAFLVPVSAALLRSVGAAALASRVASLHSLHAMEVREDLTMLGISLRSLADGLARRRADRRGLLAEGATMLHYMLGRRAPSGAIRRYARLVEILRNGRSARLPWLLHQCPAMLRTLDQRKWLHTQPDLNWRFEAACAIAEATPEGAERFIAPDAQRRSASALVRLVGIALVEAIARIGGAPFRASVRACIDA